MKNIRNPTEPTINPNTLISKFMETEYKDYRDPGLLFSVAVRIFEKYNVSLAMNRFGASFKEFGHELILTGEQGTPMDALYSSIIELLKLKFNENRN
jgi:hypothetical protein